MVDGKPSDLLSGILPDWPQWAISLLLAMSAALAVTLAVNHFYGPADENETPEEQKLLKQSHKTHEALQAEFHTFRWSYLSVYLVIMLADWMQGTHMYTLYLSYNVNISALFLTGFLSGAIFAPFLGSLVDKFGRKRSCIVYCVLEIIINWLEHYSNFGVLLLGRVLGGISTNLLFSAFESWMTTEHRRKGFPEEWMARTYSDVRFPLLLYCSTSASLFIVCACLNSYVHNQFLQHHLFSNFSAPLPMVVLQFLLELLLKFWKTCLDILDHSKVPLLLRHWQ